MKNKSTVYTLTTCALFSALMCILGPLSVPIGPIPVSLTNLVIYLSIFLLGTKGSAISYLVYILLGAVGLPVFSGFSGGLAKLTGPTGGYLFGFIFIVLIAGLTFDFSKQNPILTAIAMVIGTVVTYAFGTAWFIFQTKNTLAASLTLCVYPFIPFDLAKIVIATVLGLTIRKALKKANLL